MATRRIPSRTAAAAAASVERPLAAANETALEPGTDSGTGLDEGTLADVLGYQIALAAAATQQLFHRHIGEPLQLRAVDFSVLMLLLANAEVTQKRLGQELAVSPPNLTILLDRLQQAGLLTRERSEVDRRAQLIRLTPQGRALALQAQGISPTMEAELRRRLSPVERLMLIELLRKVSREPGAS